MVKQVKKAVTKKKPSIGAVAKEAVEAFEAMGQDTNPSTKDATRKKFHEAMLKLGKAVNG